MQLPLSLDSAHKASLQDFAFAPFAPLIDAMRQWQVGLLREMFLVGKAGTGKTHALSALCTLMSEHGTRPMLVPLRDLVKIEPSVLASLGGFDSLVIEDIDTIVGKPDWQEAVFHLINQSRERACQIVYSASYAPMDMTLIIDLQTRLSQSPRFILPSELDIATRARWLSEFLLKRGLWLDPRVTEHLLIKPRTLGEMSALVQTLTPLFAKQKKPSKDTLAQAFALIDNA